MKKALQIAILRGWVSLSEVTAGATPEEACTGGSRDELAELPISDLGGRGIGLTLDLRRHVERTRSDILGRLGRALGFGYRADGEPDRRRRFCPQPRAQRSEYLVPQQGQLVGPGGGVSSNMQRPVPAKS